MSKLLKSFEAALKKPEVASDNNHNTTGVRKWLKEASITRLTGQILNHVEMWNVSRANISVEKLDESGLTDDECSLISDWVLGKISGIIL